MGTGEHPTTPLSSERLRDDFYVLGGTMRPGAPSYIERRADRELFKALQRSEFCYVLDTRQMGKSSMMALAADRLWREGYSVVVLDLTSFGQNLTVGQWYDAQISAIGRQLRLEDEFEDFIDEHYHVGPADRWMRSLREIAIEKTQVPIVIFVDEIDFVRTLPFPTDEFFAGIRQFCNLRASDPALEKLTFCLLGVSTPTDLIRDEDITPFNLGRRIIISDFELSDLKVLKPGLDTDDRTAQQILERVYYWTDGHPYLSQRVCDEVARSEGRSSATARVDRICNRLFLAPGKREQSDNLRFAANRLLAPGVDEAAVLDLYGKVRRAEKVLDDGSQPWAETLRLSGIAKPIKGRFRVRNEIYRRAFDEQWIEENMPGQELRRQREAELRGRRRALLTAAGLFVLLGAIFSVIVIWNALQTARSQNARLQEEKQRADANAAQAIKEARLRSAETARANEQEERATEQARLAESARRSAEIAEAEARKEAQRATEAEAEARMEAQRATEAEAEARRETERAAESGQQAERAKRQAEVLQMANRAHLLLAEEPQSVEAAALLAAQAIGWEDPPPEAYAAVLRSLRMLPRLLREVEQVPIRGQIERIAQSEDRRFAAVLAGGEVCLLSTETYEGFWCVGLQGEVRQVAVSDQGGVVLAVEQPGGWSLLRRGTRGKEFLRYPEPVGKVTSIALSSGGCRAAMGGGGNSVTVIDLCGSQPDVTLRAPTPRKNPVARHVPLRLSATGSYLVSALEGAAAPFVVWDVIQRAILKDIALGEDCREPHFVGGDSGSTPYIYCRSGSGDTIIPPGSLGYRRPPRLWYWPFPRRLRAVVESEPQALSHREPTSRFAAGHQLPLLVRATRSEVKVWREGTETVLPVRGAVTRLALNLDSTLIAVGSGESALVRVIDPAGQDQSRVNILDPDSEVLFSRGPRELAVLSENGDLRVLAVGEGPVRPLAIQESSLQAGSLFETIAEGEFLLSAAPRKPQTRRIRLYDLTRSRGEPGVSWERAFQASEGFSRNGEALVVRSGTDSRGPLSVVRAEDGDDLLRLERGESLLALTTDGRKAAFITTSCEALGSGWCLGVAAVNGARRAFPVAPELAWFSIDGSLAHALDSAGRIRSWELADGTERPPQKLPLDRVAQAELSADGRVLAVTDATELVIWDMLAQESIENLPLRRIDLISASGRYVLGFGVLYDTRARRIAWSGDGGPARIDRGENRFFLAGPSSVDMVTLPDGEPAATHTTGQRARLLGFNEDETELVVLSGSEIGWYEVDSLERVGTPFILPDGASDVELSPEGRRIALTLGERPVSASRYIQVAPLSDTPMTLGGVELEAQVSAVAHSAGPSAVVAVASESGIVHLLARQADRGLAEIDPADHRFPVADVALSDDASYLAVVGGDELSLWDPRAVAEPLGRKRFEGFVDRVAMLSDPPRVVIGRESGRFDVLSVPGLATIDRQSHGSRLERILGRRDVLATVGPEKTTLWDTGAWTPRWPGDSDGSELVRLSPTGAYLAEKTGAGAVRLWDTARGVAAHLASGSDVVALAFSSDETALAAATTTAVGIWAISQEPDKDPRVRELGRIPVQTQIASIAFHPDRERLVIGPAFGSTLQTLWRPSDLTREICDRLAREPRELTAEEKDQYKLDPRDYKPTCTASSK